MAGGRAANGAPLAMIAMIAMVATGWFV